MYETLLELFFLWHNPFQRSWSRQYMSAIFYHDDDQKRKAEAAVENCRVRTGVDPCTKLLQMARFYQAEDYHQKFYLRQNARVSAEFGKVYRNPTDLMNSTFAARINGCCAGYGDADDLASGSFSTELTDNEKAVIRALTQTATMR